jgi:hypothetical protein
MSFRVAEPSRRPDFVPSVGFKAPAKQLVPCRKSLMCHLPHEHHDPDVSTSYRLDINPLCRLKVVGENGSFLLAVSSSSNSE